ncbi:MAG: hypothetical protein R3F34_07810 [Planctomycetota bacterium]
MTSLHPRAERQGPELSAALAAGAALVGIALAGVLHAFVLRDPSRVGLLVPTIALALGTAQLLFGDRRAARAIGVAIAVVGACYLGARVLDLDHHHPAESVLLASALPAVVGAYLVRRAFTRRAARPDGRSVAIVAFWSGQEVRLGGDVFAGGDAAAVMGGFELDLRHARFPSDADVVDLDVLCVMGGGTIVVPDDWTVESRVLPIMGGVSTKRGSEHVVGGKRLRIGGLALMGGLEIARS